MQITLGQIYDSLNALTELCGERLPRQAAWNISKTRKQALAEAQELEKIRLDLIEKHGPGQVKPENLAEFVREWAEARAVVTDLWATPIRFDDLPDTISAATLGALDWLIEPPAGEQPAEAARAAAG